MSAIELYKLYLRNSIEGKSNLKRIEKLELEKGRIQEIIDGAETLFDGDKSLLDKNDHSIYTLIKKEIVSSCMLRNSQEPALTSVFNLNGILSEINQLKLACVA